MVLAFVATIRGDLPGASLCETVLDVGVLQYCTDSEHYFKLYLTGSLSCIPIRQDPNLERFRGLINPHAPRPP